MFYVSFLLIFYDLCNPLTGNADEDEPGTQIGGGGSGFGGGGGGGGGGGAGFGGGGAGGGVGGGAGGGPGVIGGTGGGDVPQIVSKALLCFNDKYVNCKST